MVEVLLEAIGGVAVERENVGCTTQDRSLFTSSLMLHRTTPNQASVEISFGGDSFGVGLMHPTEIGDFSAGKGAQ